jgi:hypothetical protein
MLYRKNKAVSWVTDKVISPGHGEYALRQADMWNRLAMKAVAEFKEAGVLVSVD